MQIPADMVVNAILVAMVAHSNETNNCDGAVYHVGSSVRNPMTYRDLHDYGFKYFTAKPQKDKNGRPIKVGKVTMLNSMDSFRTYFFIHYLLPLKVRSSFLLFS